MFSNFAKKEKVMDERTMGYSGLAIADYFIERSLEEGIPVTNMSILKMIYFAHGLAYPQLNRKLVRDLFFKWPWGPVEKHTYEEFKSYGSNNITAPSGKCKPEVEDIRKDTTLTAFLDSLLPLAKIPPFVLSEKSHEKGGPWDVATFFQPIDNRTIETFFYGRYSKRQR